jgi:hypothetical protein
MAIKSSQLNITELDFEQIGDNLKNYLKGQDKLKDYDFEGSTMSILIDLLSYASHIGAVNSNIAASELFLDSAQLRKNVVSRAKDLGFTPASETASKATVDMVLSNVRNADGSQPTQNDMTMARGVIFQTVFDGQPFNFVVPTSVKPVSEGTTYTYSNVSLIQGTYATDTFIYDRQIKNSKFVLSNERVDKQHINVSVNSSGVTESYVLSTDVSTITTESKVFYTQENEDGYLEIYFGDGTLGKELSDGDIITVTYIIVDEDHANGAKTFSLTTAINGFSDATITVLQSAIGGGEKESIESIKFKANKFYTSQNRLVTLNDYKSKVSEYYPNADAIAVWGGEDNDPPEYGKVFLAIKPNNADYLSESEKTVITNNINKLNMLTVRPIIVDPDIVKILVTTTFKYNKNITQLSEGELESLVSNAIMNYDKEHLNNFDAIMRHSKLVQAIDLADSSILSNTTNIRLRKKLKPTIGGEKGYTVAMGNPLYNPHAGHNAMSGGITSSTGFKVSGDSVNTMYFDDDGNGNLRRYYLSGSTRVYADSVAGSVDYATGKISINAITVNSTVNNDSSIDFTLIPNSNDVVATRGSLIDISLSDIKVNGVIDTIASGESSAGVGYSSTSTSSY